MPHTLDAICDLIDQALHELHQSNPRGDNPYADQCYVASATLKKFFGRALVLYRTKDHTDRYHWWVETKDGQVIDLTAKQYELIGKPVPSISSAYEKREKQYPMGFRSYRKRVEELHALVQLKLLLA